MQSCPIFDHSHEDLDLTKVSLGERALTWNGMWTRDTDLLTCMDEAMEKALGWRTGMRSKRYGNETLALARGKSFKTSRIVLRGRLQ